MAATYGIVNFIASFGFTARWRNQAIEGLRLSESSQVVDLMCGMNEMCRSISSHAPVTLRLTAIDISPEMIRRGRAKWPFRVETVLGDVLTWDFAPASADLVVCSFGLKTLNRQQQAELSRQVARLLRPGGTCSFIEVSVPSARLLRWFYLFYLSYVIPAIGRLFLGDPANYRMLGIYTREFGSCQHFSECLRQHGIQVREFSYVFGCATGVRGMRA